MAKLTYMRNMKQIALTLFAASAIGYAGAQDLNFADVQQMNKWNNQSLHLDRRGGVDVNLRDIRYENVLSFRTGALLVTLPIRQGKDATASADKGYFTATGGAAFDQSNNGFFKSTTAVVGLSYAQPLNSNGLFAAAGFQGAFVSNQYGSTGTFPDQFDEFGPIAGAATTDPLRAGNRYNYFSLNVGASLFKTGGNIDWYLGGSARHLNRPFTEVNKLDEFQLSPTVGVQSGLTINADKSRFSLYGVGNMKGKANEWLLGAQYHLIVSGGTAQPAVTAGKTNPLVMLSIGCGVRVKDALIPNIGIVYNKTRVGLHYDMNSSSIYTSGFTRRGFELALTQKF
jgi:hypothetical protein